MSSNPEEITFFAKTDARGESVPFGIKAKDRTRHVYVIGKTGMGKSTLLENMAIQDMKNGNGLAFIDPHGQTAETLLDYIPESRKDDVLYFAPFDTANPVAFNVMEDVDPDRRHLVVSGLMSVFKKIWVDAWSARMEYILSNTLLALLEYPDSTLLGVNRMLSDKIYRNKVVDNVKDPSVKSFWVDEFAKYNERYMQEAGDAIKNKTGQFTSNPLIRNIVGQPKSSFDIRDMMDKKKIIIMNLSKGLVGESNANLLGSMLTTRIYLAAMSRADMGQEAMRNASNFYFYVDEFQSFANATFANILSEARKYKLNLTIAHQYIEQMEEEVRNAVFGNVGTTIAFRVGPFDAEVLETIFTPKFLAPDIVNLGFAQIYLTLMIDGIGSQPFSAVTLPPIKPATISCKEMIIHRSREQFGHPRAEIEKAILDWHAPSVVAKPVEKKEVVASSIISTPKEIVTVKSVPISAPLPDKSKVYKPEQKKVEVVPLAVKYEKKQLPQKPVYVQNKTEVITTPTEPNARIESPKEVPVEKKIVFEKPPSGKNLDELRAILHKMSVQGTEIKTSTPISNIPKVEIVESPVKNERITTPDAKVSSLRNTLASLVKEKEQTVVLSSVQTQNNQTVEAVLNKPVLVAPKEHGRIITEKQKPVSIEQQEHIEDVLSPKKLERMMRITGNDKTPLG